ncbi:MAG: OmpA family protein [Desulfomonilia bacterium]
MARVHGKTAGILLTAVLLAGCAQLSGNVSPKTGFTVVDLGSYVESGQYAKKADAFEILLDTSYSMNESLNGSSRIDTAKDLILAVNESVSGLTYDAGLRVFGQRFWNTGPVSVLVYTARPHSARQLSDAVEALKSPCGKASLSLALDDAGRNAQRLGKDTAFILITDGKHERDDLNRSLEEVKKRFGRSAVLHAVCIGGDTEAVESMKRLARTCGGVTVTAEQLTNPGDMEEFLKTVFLTARVIDSDGDGVPDSKDRCPDTPHGVPVDAAGCPLDTDGDGVADYLDECPDTPRGAQVNERGCWVVDFNNVLFDTDSSEIKPGGYAALDKVVDILLGDPWLTVEIQGHTDSVGPESYNDRLSRARAQAVKDYLVRKGIAGYRLSAVGYGESMPIASNDTDEGRAKNRRVELRPMR